MKTLVTLVLAALPLVAHATPGQPLQPWLSQVQSFQTANIRPHPRLLLTPSEITRVRASVKDPRMAAYWAAVRKSVDADKSKPTVPDPPGYKAEWTIEEWRAIGNAAGDAQNHILAAAFAWVVTQDPSDLAEAKRWTLATARWNPHGATSIEGNGVDHAAQETLHSLALSYDWLYYKWTPEEKALLQNVIAERSRALYKHLKPYRYDSWNNHAWFQTTAMVEGALALAGENPEAEAWWKYGASLYFTEYLPLGGRDGDWHEGTHYISYTLIFVYQFADSLKSATGIDACQVPWVKNCATFRLYTNPPKSGGIKFNDNNYVAPDSWDRMTAYNAARTTRDPAIEWYAESMNTTPPSNPLPALYTLIYRDMSLKAKAPGKDLPQAVWYRDSGWVVLRTDLSRSDDVELGLKAGPHLAEKGGKGHDHPDQNGFLINDGAEPLAIDSGYYDYYGSPHHNNWTFTPQAHNTFLVDGQGQLIAPEKASYVTAFASQNGGLTFIESEAADAYPKGLLKSWRRQILFVGPNTFLIHDTVKPAQPAELKMLLHGPSKFDLNGQAFVTTSKKKALAGAIVTPASLKLDQWGGFPDPPERKLPTDRPDEWHLTATTPGKVGAAEFFTVLRTGEAGKVKAPDAAFKTTADGGIGAVRIGAAGQSAVCRYFSTQGRHTVEGAVTDASAMALYGGNMVLTGVTYFSSGRRTTFRSSVPADVSGALSPRGWSAVTVRMTAPGRVRLFAAAKPKSVSGVSSWTWEKATQTVVARLPEHISALKMVY
ncbi:MAG TPA: DUF4962 domain-containing protein [Armatimonadota bacterium]|jgi:hypothetical protein